MPLILKGVQCWEDALEAYDQGLAGVVLSNHGGRQLDFARSGIEVLVEVVSKLGEKRGLKFPNEKFQLFIDGGVRRATDIIKAVALGATAGALTVKIRLLPLTCSLVGIGRPFIYAFSAYGTEGVDKALQILNVRLLSCFFCSFLAHWVYQDEFEMNMRLLGARTIKDIIPDMVDASNIHLHTIHVPSDNLYEGNCTFRSYLWSREFYIDRLSYR